MSGELSLGPDVQVVYAAAPRRDLLDEHTAVAQDGVGILAQAFQVRLLGLACCLTFVPSACYTCSTSRAQLQV